MGGFADQVLRLLDTATQRPLREGTLVGNKLDCADLPERIKDSLVLAKDWVTFVVRRAGVDALQKYREETGSGLDLVDFCVAPVNRCECGLNFFECREGFLRFGINCGVVAFGGRNDFG